MAHASMKVSLLLRININQLKPYTIMKHFKTLPDTFSRKGTEYRKSKFKSVEAVKTLGLNYRLVEVDGKVYIYVITIFEKE